MIRIIIGIVIVGITLLALAATFLSLPVIILVAAIVAIYKMTSGRPNA